MPNKQIVHIDDRELIAALRRMSGDVEKVLQAAVFAGAEVIQDLANQKAPGPHVELKLDPKVRRGELWCNIGPDKEHWTYQFLETGATEHEITGALLGYQAEGEDVVFGSRVQHPGMAAKPFLRPAFDEGKKDAEVKVGDVIRRAVEALGR